MSQASRRAVSVCGVLRQSWFSEWTVFSPSLDSDAITQDSAQWVSLKDLLWTTGSLCSSLSWVWLTSVLSYCVYSSWFLRFMNYIYSMLDLGVGDKRPEKAHCRPPPWLFWLPHSPRTCCWPAHNTFIIINGNVSVSFTREQPRQGFQINNLLGIFLSCNGNLVLDSRNRGKEGSRAVLFTSDKPSFVA